MKNGITIVNDGVDVQVPNGGIIYLDSGVMVIYHTGVPVSGISDGWSGAWITTRDSLLDVLSDTDYVINKTFCDIDSTTSYQNIVSLFGTSLKPGDGEKTLDILVDSALVPPEDVAQEIATLLGVSPDEVFEAIKFTEFPERDDILHDILEPVIELLSKGDDGDEVL